MVRFAYLGKEHGLAKLCSTVVGAVVVGVGCHSYFNSPWVKNNVYKICTEIKNITDPDDTFKNLNITCPTIAMEKCFIVVALFCFTLTCLGLIGNLFSKQLSEGIFKLGDIACHGMSGILVIIGGSLLIYSTVKIDEMFSAINEKIPCTIELSKNSSYQLYNEKLAAGSLSIVNGIVYFIVAGLLFMA